MEARYKIEYSTAGNKCVTPCPFGMTTSDGLWCVGSFLCDNCKFCVKDDEVNNLVYCGNGLPEYVREV